MPAAGVAPVTEQKRNHPTRSSSLRYSRFANAKVTQNRASLNPSVIRTLPSSSAVPQPSTSRMPSTSSSAPPITDIPETSQANVSPKHREGSFLRYSSDSNSSSALESSGDDGSTAVSKSSSASLTDLTLTTSPRSSRTSGRMVESEPVSATTAAFLSEVDNWIMDIRRHIRALEIRHRKHLHAARE